MHLVWLYQTRTECEHDINNGCKKVQFGIVSTCLISRVEDGENPKRMVYILLVRNWLMGQAIQRVTEVSS